MRAAGGWLGGGGKSKQRLPNRVYEKLGLDGVVNGYASAENETETSLEQGG